MGKKVELSLEPGENVLEEQYRYSLHGDGKLKQPVRTKCIITDRNFIYFDPGKGALLHSQFGLLGLLLRKLAQGKPMNLPLKGMKISRGKYFKNKKLLELTSADERTILLDNFDKSLAWFRGVLENNGMSLSQTAEEEWHIL